jgi:mannose-6-phosphate isomerase
MLGDAATSFGSDLPFLLKVLSVRTALSIQSHPDKALAERLHWDRPDVYKDANHKPEMAIALTEFEALCGFCSNEEIKSALQEVPELRGICGERRCRAYASSSPGGRKEALRDLFTALMTADKIQVHRTISSIMERLQQAASSRPLTPKEELTIRLNDQYPSDVGVLAAWFLNYVTLRPGEAIALAANEPHAYIHGDIVECMATSDNVIRAGLTPKLRDTAVLCSSLTYNQGLPEITAGQGDSRHMTVLYRPPFDEFEVWKLSSPAGTQMHLPMMRGPIMMLVQQGTGTVRTGSDAAEDRTMEIHRGHVMFVPAHVGLFIASVENLTLWIAAPNGMGLKDV